VLRGADTDKIRKFGHEKLSTYNIGGEHSRADWSAIGRELVRLGFLYQNAEKFNVVEITDSGRAALKARQKIILTKAVAAGPVEHRVGEIACDEALFEKLRWLRKRLADDRGVPPYVVFSDITLRQMARLYPVNEHELSRVSGIGEKKMREFGEIFLREIATHLQTSPRQIFADDSFSASAPGATKAAPRRSLMTDTVRETLQSFRQGKSIAEIARLRGVKDGTIYGHLEQALLAGESINVNSLVPADAQREIADAFARHGFLSLAPIVESFAGKYGYGECRLVRATLQIEQKAR